MRAPARKPGVPIWALALALGLVVVVAVVVVTTLAGHPAAGPTGSTGKPQGALASAPQEPAGRRPVTQVATSKGRTLTVAQDGSGQYPTIAAAAAAAQPGDTVVIAAGTYTGPVDVPRDGTQGSPITFQAAPGADVVLTGDADHNGLVYLAQRSWVTLIGLTVQDSSRHGIYAVGANHVVVQDCAVTGSHDGGMVFIDGSDVHVVHSEVHHANAGGSSTDNEAMSFMNVDGFEAAYDLVTDSAKEGIDAKYEARNGTIHNNTATHNNGPNIYVDAVNTVDVYANTVTAASGGTKSGIMLGIESESPTHREYAVRLYDNVITGNAGGGIDFYVESDGTYSDIQIVNNTVVGNGGPGIDLHNRQFTGTNVLRNNIFSGNRVDVAGHTDGFTIDHNLFSTTAVGQAAVTGQPTFVDAQGGNLKLAPGSVGVDAGTPDGAPPADITGAPRNSGVTSVGAFG